MVERFDLVEIIKQKTKEEHGPIIHAEGKDGQKIQLCIDTYYDDTHYTLELIIGSKDESKQLHALCVLFQSDAETGEEELSITITPTTASETGDEREADEWICYSESDGGQLEMRDFLTQPKVLGIAGETFLGRGALPATEIDQLPKKIDVDASVRNITEKLLTLNDGFESIDVAELLQQTLVEV